MIRLGPSNKQTECAGCHRSFRARAGNQRYCTEQCRRDTYKKPDVAQPAISEPELERVEVKTEPERAISKPEPQRRTHLPVDPLRGFRPNDDNSPLRSPLGAGFGEVGVSVGTGAKRRARR